MENLKFSASNAGFLGTLFFWVLVQLAFVVGVRMGDNEPPTKAATLIGLLYGLLGYLAILGFRAPGRVFAYLGASFKPLLFFPLIGGSAVYFYGEIGFFGSPLLDSLLPGLAGVPVAAAMGAGIWQANFQTLFAGWWVIALLAILAGLVTRARLS